MTRPEKTCQDKHLSVRETKFPGISTFLGTARISLPLSSGLTLSMWRRGKVVSHKNQGELYVKNLHVGGTASIGCCTHTLLCVFQVHLGNGLSGIALGCFPCRDLKPSHCLPVLSHTTPAWNRPPGVSWGTADWLVLICECKWSISQQKTGIQVAVEVHVLPHSQTSANTLTLTEHFVKSCKTLNTLKSRNDRTAAWATSSCLPLYPEHVTLLSL